jgi:uncharacterized protein (TIGR02145 family)
MKLNLTLIIAVCIGVSSCHKNDNMPKPPVQKTSGASTPVTVDGVSYPTAIIGTQTWTTMDYKGTGALVFSFFKDTAYLYTYPKAMNITPPAGWRLPTAEDFSVLCTYLGGIPDNRGYGTVTGAQTEQLTTSDWEEVAGNNKTLFGAKPVGVFFSSIPVYNGGGVEVGYWSTTPLGTEQLCFFMSIIGTTGAFYQYGSLQNSLPTDAYSIRFVKDN